MMTRLHSLTLTTPSDREITLTRTFVAPRDLVFEALTKPALVQRWLLGPPGWTMPVCEIDLRIGGAYRYVWRHADGREMGMGGVYQEINRPDRLVHTEKFDSAWYPGDALATSILNEQSGKTILTATILYDSQATRDAVLKSGMERGVTASYDRLEEILAATS